jgi:RNase P/RNase MRP subunit p29
MRTLDSQRLKEYEKKWHPVIEGIFPSLKNRSVLRMICYYAEWISSDPSPDASVLPKMLAELKSRLESFERIEVEGKFYNPATGNFEFKLKNGRYVPIDTEFEYKLSDGEMIEIFGIELLSKVDRTWARDHAINNLLGNG